MKIMTSTEVQHSSIKSVKVFLTLLCLFFSIISTETFANPKAAKVIILRGDVQMTTKDGKTQKLKRGDWLPEGAIVKTAAKSFAKLLFIDKSSLNVAPKSQMTIKKFAKGKAGIISS